jgi:valyl-tRNA synthetase
MVAMCQTLTGQVPFKEILFHGLIKDSEGRKMSKSIGNVIDPLDLINGVSFEKLIQRIKDSSLTDKEKHKSIQYQTKIYPKGIQTIGSDATRLTLLKQDFKNDELTINIISFDEAKRYCNKIWQSVRFFERCLLDIDPNKTEGKTIDHGFKLMNLNDLINNQNCSILDKWILSRLVETVQRVDENFNTEYNIHLNVKCLRDFFYFDFCDFYLETIKEKLKNDDSSEARQVTWNVVREVLSHILILYHPFMPSITEELWQSLNFNNKNESILNQKYPKYENNYFKSTEMDEINSNVLVLRTIVQSILNIKQFFHKKDPIVYIKCKNSENNLSAFFNEIAVLSKSSSVHFINDDEIISTISTDKTIYYQIDNDSIELFVQFKVIY